MVNLSILATVPNSAEIIERLAILFFNTGFVKCDTVGNVVDCDDKPQWEDLSKEAQQSIIDTIKFGLALNDSTLLRTVSDNV